MSALSKSQDAFAWASASIETQSIGPRYSTADLPTDALFSQQTNLVSPSSSGTKPIVDINIASVWAAGYTGKDISIGVYDTAMDVKHVDLSQNVDMSRRVVAAGLYVDPTKIATHGDEHATAVAGIIAGARNDVGVVGIAYDAHLTPVDIFDGSGATASYMWNALQNQARFAITNHSWSFTGAFVMNQLSSGPQAELAGFSLAAATGRGGLGTLANVAAANYRQYGLSTESNGMTVDRHVMVIGATDQYGDVAYYSNPGASLLVVAPSSGDDHGVSTDDVTGALGYSSGDYTDTFGGTSAATPELSGIEADMLQANPTLGWRDVQSILAMTARHTGSDIGAQISGYEGDAWSYNGAGNWNGGGLHFSNDYGFGLVDAAAAVRAAQAWNFAFGAAETSANEMSAKAAATGKWDVGHGHTTTITFSIGTHESIEAVAVNLTDLMFLEASHLIVTLTSPDGTTSHLLNLNGGDDGQITQGWQLMSREFLGEDAFGTWTLSIESTDAADYGSLSKASLVAYGSNTGTASVFVYTDEYASTWTQERSVLSYDKGAATIFAAPISGDISIDLQSGSGTIDGVAVTIASGTRIGTIVTGDGDNHIVAGDTALTVWGGAGHDDILGGAAGDRLNGGAGDDIIEGGGGNDVLKGGDGFDTLSFAHAATGIAIILATAAAQNTRDGVDMISGFEAVTGSAHDDIITGTAGNNTLDGGVGDDILTGGAGADTLIGGGGSDTASYAGSKLAVVIDLSAGTASGGDADGDTLSGIASLTGSAFNDTLTGDSHDNVLKGGAGNDVLAGGDGNDTLIGGAGADQLDGGADINTLSYAGSATGVTIDLSLGIAKGGDALGDVFVNFSNVIGSNGNDVLTGDSHDNLLNGGAGNDVLIGGAGADALDGGAGIDAVSYAASADGVSIDLSAGTGHGGDAEGDTLANIETIIGSALADALTGNAGNNRLDGGIGDDTIEGGGGNDVLIGGDGFDTLSFAHAAAGIVVSLAVATAQNTRDGIDIISGFEAVTGSAHDDVIVGDAGNNTLNGGDGNDVLTGGAGADTLIGGDGSDTAAYAGSRFAVAIDLSAGTASGGDADGDTLSGIDNITGSAFNDTLTGDSHDNVLNGGAGADHLDGGDGVNTLSYAGSNVGVTIDLSLGLAKGGDAQGDVFVNFSNVTGSNGNDVLTGDSHDNLLNGGAGNDVLIGGAGADTLDGGAGIDTASYAVSADGVSVNLTTGIGHGGDAEGDTLLRIENVVGSTFADTLTGNAGNNVLSGGADNDIIEGGGGNDVLRGGDGFDTLSFAHAAMGITVNLAITTAQNTHDGVDTISGFEAVTGTAHDDVISGNALANTLDGGDGNDILTGGGGADTLIGGAGNDQFRFNMPSQGGDVITDFNNTTEADLIAISRSGFGLSKAIAFDTGDAFDFAAHYFAASSDGSATETGHGQFLFNTATHQLSWDADGAGAKTATLLATFSNDAILTAHDFLLA